MTWRPRLFVIGAPKCGTTTLFSALSHVPGTVPCAIKEPNFFEYDRSFARGFEAYLQLFEPDPGLPVQVGFEATPWYLYSATAAARIEAAVGADARFVICVRDPVDRAVSHYRDFQGGGREDRSFRSAMHDELARVEAAGASLEGRETGYLSGGFYLQAAQLFTQRFGVPSVRFVTLEQLRDDLSGTLGTISEWLGLPRVGDDVPLVASETNPASALRSRRLHDGMMGMVRSPIGRAARRAVPWRVEASVGGAWRRWMRKSVTTPGVPTEDVAWLRERTAALFRDELIGLRTAGVSGIDRWPSVG